MELLVKCDLFKVFDMEIYVQWWILWELEDVRYLGLLLLCVFVCQFYGVKFDLVEEFVFEEEFGDDSYDNYGWMNFVYVMVVNINWVYKEYGWMVRICGVESGGLVEELLIYVFEIDDGGVDQKCFVEIVIFDCCEYEILCFGLILFIYWKNID